MFHAESTKGGYQLTYEAAVERCIELGAQIATKQQLETALSLGLEK